MHNLHEPCNNCNEPSNGNESCFVIRKSEDEQCISGCICFVKENVLNIMADKKGWAAACFWQQLMQHFVSWMWTVCGGRSQNRWSKLTVIQATFSFQNDSRCTNPYPVEATPDQENPILGFTPYSRTKTTEIKVWCDNHHQAGWQIVANA